MTDNPLSTLNITSTQLPLPSSIYSAFTSNLSQQCKDIIDRIMTDSTIMESMRDRFIFLVDQYNYNPEIWEKTLIIFIKNNISDKYKGEVLQCIEKKTVPLEDLKLDDKCLAELNNTISTIADKINNKTLLDCSAYNLGFKLHDIKFVKGYDKNKFVLLVGNGPNSYVIKFYMYPVAQTSIREVQIYDILSTKNKNLVKHTDTYIGKGVCQNKQSILTIYEILEENCQDQYGVCGKLLYPELDESDIVWVVTKYGDYGTLRDALSIKAVSSTTCESIYRLDDIHIMSFIFQLLWQQIKFVDFDLIHGDIFDGNIMIYINGDYNNNIDQYYEYNIGTYTFYVKVLPFIIKFFDYGDDEIYTGLDIKPKEKLLMSNLTNFKGLFITKGGTLVSVPTNTQLTNYIESLPIITTLTFVEDYSAMMLGVLNSTNYNQQLDTIGAFIKPYVKHYGMKSNSILTDIIPSNILSGGRDMDYYSKYIKYKTKYISTKYR